MKPASRYSGAIRALHALLAIAIVAQMTLTLVMDHPRTKRPMTPDGAYWFGWHEWVGIAAFAILFAGWAYRLGHWSRDGGRLFPWVSSAGRAALARELGAFLTLRWKSIPPEGALPGTVHGLGMLMASFFALTGVTLYLLLQPANTVTPLVRQLMDVHQFLGPAMWTFLAGHALMAIWHQFTGADSLARMFSPR